MSESYEIYAVKYGHHERKASENFLGGDAHDGPMPLDYFVWAVVGKSRSFILDTGFDAAMGKKRQREVSRPIDEGLKAIGVDPGAVRDVVISHMHYDHAGNHAMFPQARYHLQDKEMQYCTGRCMCHAQVRLPFEPDDVTAMVRRVYEGRVQFHDGADELADGVFVHWVGGHTMGLQIMRVRTRRGWVVLASDATHLYANIEQGRSFPILYNLAEMHEGYATIRKLAESPHHIIPGHDPLVLKRYPAAKPGLDGIVRCDADPLV
jgi:glyoxylase-like metal-dependent hydrolase (beta-lactamase superfamily II)